MVTKQFFTFFFLSIVLFSYTHSYSQGFNSIFSKNGSDVIAVGTDGALFRSWTGGTSWGTYSLGSNDLNSVYAIGNFDWIVGNNGTTTINNFKLYQNYPNSFNQVTIIKYDVKDNSTLKISVFDITGRIISILSDEFYYRGTYETEFNGNNLSSGIYFCKIEAGNYSDTKTMVLIK